MVEKIGNEPIGDDELPLMEHLSELRRRLVIIIIPIIIVIAIIFPFSNQALAHIFTDLFPDQQFLFVYSPIEWMNLRFLFCLLCALAVTIPLLLYEAYAFIAPGLYPHEKRFIIKILLPSLLLYLLGVILAYYLVLPAILSAIVPYGEELAETALSAKRVFSLIIYTAMCFGLIFQVPLVVILAVKLEITNYQSLRAKRGVIYIAAVAIALFINIDPTGISQILIAVILVVLFELSLLITRLIWR